MNCLLAESGVCVDCNVIVYIVVERGAGFHMMMGVRG